MAEFDKEIPAAEHSIAGIVNIMHGISESHAPMQGSLGKVIAPPPNIDILWNGIHLTKEQIYISKYLLPNYTRHMKGETSYRGGGAGDPAYESHNHPIDNDETWTDTLKVGEWVTVFPVEMEGEQLYMITDQMVKL